MKNENMDFNKAFHDLINTWKIQPKEFREKYKSYRSKYLSRSDYVGEKKMREMLLKAGYKENWTNNK